MADGAGRRGGRCVPERMGRRQTGTDDAVGRTSGRGKRGGKAADGRADGGGKGADSGAEGRTGPTRRRHADGRKRRGWGLGGADKTQHVRTGGQADERTSGRADG